MTQLEADILEELRDVERRLKTIVVAGDTPESFALRGQAAGLRWALSALEHARNTRKLAA